MLSSWELLWDSGTHAQFKTTIPCRSKEPARWFKLYVLKGEHRNSLNIHGILQDFVSGSPYGASTTLIFHLPLAPLAIERSLYDVTEICSTFLHSLGLVN